jgi:hypothetical protein
MEFHVLIGGCMTNREEEKCRNVGQLSTFDMAHPRKLKFYVELQLVKSKAKNTS